MWKIDWSFIRVAEPNHQSSQSLARKRIVWVCARVYPMLWPLSFVSYEADDGKRIVIVIWLQRW